MATLDNLRLKLALKELDGKPLLEGVRIPWLHSSSDRDWHPTEDLRTWIDAAQKFLAAHPELPIGWTIMMPGAFWHSERVGLETLDMATDEAMKEADQ